MAVVVGSDLVAAHRQLIGVSMYVFDQIFVCLDPVLVVTTNGDAIDVFFNLRKVLKVIKGSLVVWQMELAVEAGACVHNRKAIGGFSGDVEDRFVLRSATFKNYLHGLA